ncbi:endonuclease domain-containing protein [Pelagibacterium sp.]|uniref:endonuclease domain-containing protein n=1 Tax=Pelagibacterium sp. TaxID=1967288 RepID=UPI003BABCEE9
MNGMTVQLAQKLRSNPTEAEKRMWRLLHPFRTGGFHFRKQVAMGPYVADFACHRAALVIEIDGGQHYTEAGRVTDGPRTEYLGQKGYEVLRFSNLDVLQNPDGVYDRIHRYLAGFNPRPRKRTN